MDDVPRCRDTMPAPPAYGRFSDQFELDHRSQRAAQSTFIGLRVGGEGEGACEDASIQPRRLPSLMRGHRDAHGAYGPRWMAGGSKWVLGSIPARPRRVQAPSRRPRVAHSCPEVVSQELVDLLYTVSREEDDASPYIQARQRASSPAGRSGPCRTISDARKSYHFIDAEIP